MFILFVALAVASLICLIAGGAMALARYGKTRRRSGPEVGAETMRGQLNGGSTFFAGWGMSVERKVDVSVGDLVAARRAGHRREGLPFLLAMAGLEGMLIFGGLALLLAMESKLFGGIVIAMGLYGLC
jgi:hypothetical protein